MGIIERTRVALPPVVTRLDIAYVAAPVAAAGTSVPFAIQVQQRDLWCWIALASSVRAFYRPAVPVTQCSLAGSVLATSCCDAGECDVRGRPEKALLAVAHLGSVICRTAAAMELRAELAAGHVAGALVVWQGGGGHVLAISGIRPSPDGAWLQVDDPWDASRTHVLADRFATGFKHIGTWNSTYWTTP